MLRLRSRKRDSIVYGCDLLNPAGAGWSDRNVQPTVFDLCRPEKSCRPTKLNRQRRVSPLILTKLLQSHRNQQKRIQFEDQIQRCTPRNQKVLPSIYVFLDVDDKHLQIGVSGFL